MTRARIDTAPIDLHIGARLRQRRLHLGLRQQELGDRVGVSFQQIQKYECGTDRISASRLWLIAKALRVPVTFFFKDLPEVAGEAGNG